MRQDIHSCVQVQPCDQHVISRHAKKEHDGDIQMLADGLYIPWRGCEWPPCPRLPVPAAGAPRPRSGSSDSIRTPFNSASCGCV